MTEELQNTLAALSAARAFAAQSKAVLDTAKQAFERNNRHIIDVAKADAATV